MHDLANDEQSKTETCSLGLSRAASTAVQRLEHHLQVLESAALCGA
jgi:hypothetical protein